MFLDNSKIFKEGFLCIRNLIIMSDGEYGFHIYFLHGYLDIEFSFYTENENLIDIINEINEKIEKLERSKNEK